MANQFFTPEGWYVEDVDSTQYMLPSGEYFNGTGAAALRGLVFLYDVLAQYPSAQSPSGERVVLEGDVLMTRPAQGSPAGVSLVFDSTLMVVREAVAGESILTP